MKIKLIVICICTVTAFGILWTIGHQRTFAKEVEPSAASRQSVELTVYKQDFGMVHEQRPSELISGENRLQVREVSKQHDPHSVLLGWNGGQAEITSHSYDLGVANSDSLLNRYVGRDVEVVRYGDNGHESERQKGKLMVESGSEIVLQDEGKLYVHPKGTIVTPVDKSIVTIPQLSVQAQSPSKQSGKLDLAYLTRGLSWSSDYVATLSPKDDSLKLECWATVTNRTGTDYPNAKVSLVAGSPNRAALPAGMGGGRVYFADGSAKRGESVATGRLARNIAVTAPESIGEFHEYRIKNATTVVQEQMNRLLMLAGDRVMVKRDYNTRLPTVSIWEDVYNWGTREQPKRGSVQLALSFHNYQSNGLGDPLPQGAIRVYEPDKSGSLRYTGAASIPDTARDQKVDITLSSAFDVFTEFRVVSSRKVAKRTYRKQIEALLHNEKTLPVNLRIVQGFSGRWKIITESNRHQNLNAYETQWTVPIPAGGQTALTYEVELTE